MILPYLINMCHIDDLYVIEIEFVQFYITFIYMIIYGQMYSRPSIVFFPPLPATLNKKYDYPDNISSNCQTMSVHIFFL